MSSRVVLENDGAQRTEKLRIIFFCVGLRERGSRVIARLVVQSRVVAHSSAFWRKTKESSWIIQRGRPGYLEKAKSFRTEAFLSKPEREKFSWRLFISAVILAAVVLGKTKESYSTMWTTLAVLCRVAEEISLLGDEKKKKKEMMIERVRNWTTAR